MVRECRLDSSGSDLGPLADCCEHGDKPSGSIKGAQFLYQLSTVSFSKVSFIALII
jgi:hypothetical protein